MSRLPRELKLLPDAFQAGRDWSLKFLHYLIVISPSHPHSDSLRKQHQAMQNAESAMASTTEAPNAADPVKKGNEVRAGSCRSICVFLETDIRAEATDLPALRSTTRTLAPLRSIRDPGAGSNPH